VLVFRLLEVFLWILTRDLILCYGACLLDTMMPFRQSRHHNLLFQIVIEVNFSFLYFF